MNRDGKWEQQIAAVVENQSPDQASDTLYTNLNDINEIFSDYPTLLYDGPFSEHILQAEPLYLTNKPAVKESKAREIAASTLNIAVDGITDAATVEHNAVPCYVYYTEEATVAVTKQGGVVNYFNHFREIGEATLSYEQCIEQAKAYLISLTNLT